MESKYKLYHFQENEWDRDMELMNMIIKEGKSWPFENESETVDAYRNYFLSHSALIVRDIGGIQDVMRCFNIKPNFPGQCSYICNGGFITAPEYRKMGVATFMGQAFSKFAKDLGYK
jgi:GNAT superfamily N-acetyltransferase